MTYTCHATTQHTLTSLVCYITLTWWHCQRISFLVIPCQSISLLVIPCWRNDIRCQRISLYTLSTYIITIITCHSLLICVCIWYVCVYLTCVCIWYVYTCDMYTSDMCIITCHSLSISLLVIPCLYHHMSFLVNAHLSWYRMTHPHTSLPHTHYHNTPSHP